MNVFEEKANIQKGLFNSSIATVQVNLGLICNQACSHCHLEASPQRHESMDLATIQRVIEICNETHCSLVDITGGAPELNPHFVPFIKSLNEKGHSVQVRTNLTVLLETENKMLPELFRDLKIRLVASLPCYLDDNVAKQRGSGIYKKSIAAIKHLNSLGYGQSDDLVLDLVYNPGGPFLPPDQGELEAAYRAELKERFDISFTRLIAITNMPLGRFGKMLKKEHLHDTYLGLLKEAFNPATVEGLMCRHQISIRWDSMIYDCDFNLARKLPVGFGAPDSINCFDSLKLIGRKIMTGEHCFGCTAGKGSSCSGVIIQV